MIEYNDTYDRWITDEGKVYRQDNSGAFIECKQSMSHGYLTIKLSKPYRHDKRVHKLVWETFNGEIPNGYEIDHQDTHKDNNALSNLKLCTHKENCNNPLTLEHSSQSRINKAISEFGQKYFEHFGYLRNANINQYNREHKWYREHNKTCRWE